MSFSLDRLMELVFEQRPHVSIGEGIAVINGKNWRYVAFESLIGMPPFRVAIVDDHVLIDCGNGPLIKVLYEATEDELVIHVIDYVIGRQEIN